jgi:hypothetical protein
LYLDLIQKIKKNTKQEAENSSLEVFSENRIKIGSLLPVGPWILSDDLKIQKISVWRQRVMRMFLAQFDSTYEKTLAYLKNSSIGEINRIFFLILDENKNFVGHIGLSNINETSCELDNLVRGEEGGDPRLMFHSEQTILHWAFQMLHLKESYLKALSYNWLVLSLHEEIGYKLHTTYHLKKVEINNSVSHEFVPSNQANVNYTCVKMHLSKEDFYKKNNTYISS